MGSPVDGLRRCPFTSPDITFKASTEWAFAEDIVFPEYYTIWAGILSLHVFPACAKACHLPPSCYAPYCLEGECHPDFVTAMLNPRSGESEEVTEEEEEEEHLALADSTIVVPIDEPIFPPEGTKPTLDETIVLANDLMDQKLRTYVEKSDNKREGVSDLVQKETTHGHNNTLQERHCRSSYKDFQRLLKSMTNLSERIQVRLGLKRKRYAFSVNKAVVVQCTNLSALPDGSEDVVVTVMRPTGFRALY
ncbi:hypothetical protein Tco_0099393 [Tanacetum coccineum]